MKRVLFDLEGNDFLEGVTVLHCIEAVDVDTGEGRSFGPDEITEGVEYLKTADILIAHNGLRYDFPVLKKLYDFELPLDRMLDTLVIARLKHPDVKATDARYNKSRLAKGEPTMGGSFGKHTIEAWGIRLKVAKYGTDITDYSQWTPDIQARCKSDVHGVGLRLWKFLDPDKMSQKAIALEHRVAVLCERITQAGWPFDSQKAIELHLKLVERREALEKELVAQFGSWWQNNGEWTPKRPNKALGYWGEYVEDKLTHVYASPGNGKRFVGYPLTKIARITFNPRSRAHIALCLKRLGWAPEEYTDSGDPKLDEEVIESLSHTFPQAKGLVEYLMVTKRLGQLADGDAAWFKHVKDGKVHASYNTMGAVTSRASHFGPNIAQVPASSSPYGAECRELFCVPEGWEMLGADMSGLELKDLAHYMAKFDGGAYGRLLDGDVHWANVIAMGFFPEGTERDKHDELHTLLREVGAKRFLYAWLYGAGDEKGGRIILDACRAAMKKNPEWAWVYEMFFGKDLAPPSKALKKVGSTIKAQFVGRTPGLSKLLSTVRMMAASGYLPGLDNRRVPVRSEHAALNTLLQSAGAILCKQWICDAYDALIADGLRWGWDGDFVFLGWIHDELQIACRKGLGERIGRIVVDCARRSGEPYGFRIRLDSEYKIGRTWADTH